jgi:hypothetical protein
LGSFWKALVMSAKKTLAKDNKKRQVRRGPTTRDHVFGHVRLDDATTSPHLGDTTVVQVPSVFLGGFSEQDESLSVRDDLGGVKGLLEVIDELLLVTGESLSLGAGKGLGSSNSFVLDGGQASGKDGFTDQGDGATQVQGVDGGPLTGTLLTGLVEDLGDDGFSIFVVLSENVSSNFDQE